MKIRIAVIIFCIALMLVVTSVIDSFNHSDTDTPEPADVIIMLGGEMPAEFKRQPSFTTEAMQTMS